MLTKEVIEHFGSPSEAAKALHISASAISQWGEHPPMGRQWQIQTITNGKLRAENPAQKLAQA